MNVKNIFGTICLFLVALLIVATGVSANSVPVSIDKAEINGVEISPFDFNRLSLDRNQEFELKLTLVADEDVKNVEILAFVSGYEYNKVERISDSTPLFDADKDVIYVKRLNLRLPEEVEEDDYKLRVVISDRNGDQVTETYDLKVDVPRHKLKIEDVTLFPGSRVKDNQAVLAKVRLGNKGEKDERDVKVTVSVPDFGLRQTAYLDEVEVNEEESSEELYLKIPKCAKAGDHNMVVEVSYDNDHQKVSTSKTLTVEDNEACKQSTATTSTQPNTTQPTTQVVTTDVPQKSRLRSALEMVLVVLVALLVVIGLVIGFSKLREDDE